MRMAVSSNTANVHVYVLQYHIIMYNLLIIPFSFLYLVVW